MENLNALGWQHVALLAFVAVSIWFYINGKDQT